MNLPELVSPIVGERVSLAFSLLLVFHVFAGLTCIVTGAVAITVALRCERSSTPISPTTSPGPTSSMYCPLRSTRAVPSSMARTS